MGGILAALLCVSAAMGSSGCAAVLAAGGTFAWQSGKVIAEERVPMERAAQAARRAFRDRKIVLKEDVVRSKAVQLRGEEPGGANVNVDVISTGLKSCRLEIRVGLGDKKAARRLLEKIRNRF